MKRLTLLSVFWVLVVSFASAFDYVPFQITNNSAYSDEDIYIGLVGRTQIDGDRSIWINFAENSISNTGIHNINTSYNTIHKNAGDWGYGNIFTKLSDIKDKMVYMPMVYACRIFVAFRSPLYIHLFDEGGYVGVNLKNPDDPNAGIRFEVIEFSWAPNGLWINTTRVDAFMYPMGCELWGKPDANNAYMKCGELLNYKQITDKWKQQLGNDPDFKNCYRDIITFDNLGGVIEQASKINAFAEGGSSQNYFQNYIDQVWDYFSTHTLTCNQGERGVWTGRVSGGVLTMTSSWGGGRTAIIPWKPNTQDVIEGKGALASGSEDDKALQAQFCGALSRGVILLKEGEQNWGDENLFFKQNTYNKYVWFFHQPEVSYNRKTYAFAYDDTFDQSSTLVTSKPDRVKVTIGGFTTEIDENQSGGTTPQPQKTSVTGLGGTYKIQGYNGLFWDCDGNSTDHNTHIVQWNDEGAEIYQQWVLDEVEAGVYTISPKSNTARKADMYWGNDENRTEVYICDATGNTNQKFKIYSVGDGYYQIVPSYSTRVLEIANASNTAGENISMYDNNDQKCSYWKLVTPPAAQDPEPEPEPDEKDFWVIYRNSVADMDDNYRDLRASSFAAWAGTAVQSEANGRYEGDDVITHTITDAALGTGWFGFGAINAVGELPFGNIQDYKLHFAYKTDYNEQLAVKIGFAKGEERTVAFTPIADGKWHTQELSMSSFKDAGVVFENASGNLLFSIVREGGVAKTGYISLDDVYYYKNSPIAIVTTSINEIEEEETISVYPNPAKDYITIKGIDENTQYTIINLIGQVVISGQGNSADVTSLLQGYYTLIANNKAVKFMKK